MNGPIYIPTSSKDALGLSQKDVQQMLDSSVGPLRMILVMQLLVALLEL